MSKRFEWHSYYKRMVLDTKINKIIKVIDTLNQQDQRLAELEELLKNARKEVCDEIKNKIEQAKLIYEWKCKEITIEEILDKIQGEK